jgi:hypothetical protein
MFLSQHAMLHSAKISRGQVWSYENEILDDITEWAARRIPHRCDHSVVWCIWHIARIEDITMNILIAGESQVLRQANWLERMGVTAHDSGNAMDADEVAHLSSSINIDALRAYRLAVGRRTRRIVNRLPPEALKQRVGPSRLKRVMDEGAVVEAAKGIVQYWGNLTTAGLLLMPPTRHCFIHLNEAMRIKKRSL